MFSFHNKENRSQKDEIQQLTCAAPRSVDDSLQSIDQITLADDDNNNSSSMFAGLRLIFGSAVFNLFCVHTVLLYISYDIPYVYGPVRGSALGLTDSQASLLVSIIGIFSTVGQVR